MAKQPASLYSTILHNYAYEEIRNLCFTEEGGVPPSFANIFDCEWGVWRDKAVADFAISEEFFDLIRTLSGPQRYLQIASYVKLTPLSGVRVYQNTGVIEGVYEAVGGFNKAEEREDTEMLLWFAQRARENQQEYVERLDSIWLDIDEKKAKEPGLFLDEPFVYTGDKFVYLTRATKKGRIDILDAIIHDVFNLPQGFSIARDITKHHNYYDKDFWKNKGYLLDLPLQELDETIEDFYLQDLLKAGFKSGDTRIADFYLSIFRNKKEDILEAANRARSGYSSLLKHGKPEDAYGIALRSLEYQSAGKELPYHMVEVAFLLLQRNKRRRSQTRFLMDHMGDVASIMAILPLCSKKDARRTLQRLTEEWDAVDYRYMYPLSTMLLKQHYQTLPPAL
jgi:hypothetical protein